MSDFDHTYLYEVYTAAARAGKTLPSRSAPVHH